MVVAAATTVVRLAVVRTARVAVELAFVSRAAAPLPLGLDVMHVLEFAGFAVPLTSIVVLGDSDWYAVGFTLVLGREFGFWGLGGDGVADYWEGLLGIVKCRSTFSFGVSVEDLEVCELDTVVVVFGDLPEVSVVVIVKLGADLSSFVTVHLTEDSR